MNAQDKNLLSIIRKIIGDEDYQSLLDTIGVDNYHLIDKTGLDNLRLNKVIEIFSKVPRDIADKLIKAKANNKKFKLLGIIKRFQYHVDDETLFYKLIQEPETINLQEYAILESRIPFTFARKLINGFGIKNSVIVKISRPYAYIMK